MTKLPIFKTLRGTVAGGVSLTVLLSAWSVAFCAGQDNPKPVSEPSVQGEMRRQVFGSDRTVQLIGELVTSEIDPLERERAVMDLGRTCNPSAITILERALSDNDSRVRSAAALALCNFTSDQACGLLAGALERTDATGDDLTGALRAARTLRWEGLSDSLVKLLNNPDATIRSDALNALTDMSRPADAGTLKKLLSDTGIAVRLAAAKNALLSKPDATLAEAMAKHADNDRPAIRAACLAALGRQDARKYLSLLIAGGNDENPIVRQGAVEGLISAGQGEKVVAFLGDASTPVLLSAVRGPGNSSRR